MDKIKPYLALLKKHHFWLLVVLMLGISAYAWWSGTAAYNAAYTTNAGQVSSTFSKVKLVTATPNPPNGTYKEALGEFRTQQATSTLKAWQSLYDRQKDLLTWPEWAKDIANAKPAATGEAEGAPAPVQEFTDTRTNYLNSFPKYFAELFKIVKPIETLAAAPPPAKTNVGGVLPAAGQPAVQPVAQTTGIVEWPSGDRETIVAKYHWKTTPTITQVRIAQENYWLYRALLEIIAKTNESAGATDRYNAAIKKIETVAIAQEALAAPKATIEKLSPEILASIAGDTSATATKPPNADSPDPELLANRYVDPQGTPVAAETAGAEFKLIPMWMRFRIDQRAIPNLLIACANSAIPVEVRQVLYNPSSGASGGSGRSPQAAAPEQAAGESFFDCTVEIRGVIYLFNPPNKEALGLLEPAGDESAGPGADAGVDPSTPAVTNPPTDPESPAATDAATTPAVDATSPPAVDATAPADEAAPQAGTEPPEAEGAPTAVPAGDATQPQ